jgi:hypothetical protein
MITHIKDDLYKIDMAIDIRKPYEDGKVVFNVESFKNAIDIYDKMDRKLPLSRIETGLRFNYKDSTLNDGCFMGFIGWVEEVNMDSPEPYITARLENNEHVNPEEFIGKDLYANPDWYALSNGKTPISEVYILMVAGFGLTETCEREGGNNV